jgi:hypothetical protein
MTRRWAWWTAGGLLLVVLLALGAWRFSRGIPDRLRKAEEDIRREAARYGLGVSFRNPRFHLLSPRISLDNVEIRDVLADLPLFAAETLDLAFSPTRLLSGGSPVSRIRIRKFLLTAGEANRPVIDRLLSAESGGTMPEILLLEGKVRLRTAGPFSRMEARIPELRIREVRFLGTRVTFQAEDAAGAFTLPGTGEAVWPFASMEGDFFLRKDKDTLRVRRAYASGPAASIKLSGSADTERRTGDVKVSGTVDMERWMSSGAPAGPWLRRFAEKGNIEFSAALSGSMEDIEGTGKVVLREGRFRGAVSVEGEAQAAFANRKVRLDVQKGKVLGGTLSGSGTYDLRTGRGEGKVSLARASFGGLPWSATGTSWRPAGTGDVEISVSGDLSRFRGTLQWRNPDGIEKTAPGGSPELRIRLPITASADAEATREGEIAVSSFRIRAGGAEVSGRGGISLPKKRVRLGGTFSVPRGRAADYGRGEPVSWAAIGGGWKADGSLSRPLVAMHLEAQALAVKDFPPVPVVVKFEADPYGPVHFVADVPAKVAKTTVTGTFTSPLSAAPMFLEATAAARDIDFPEAFRWAFAAMARGRDGEPEFRFAEGIRGSGTADLTVSASEGEISVAGSLRSAGFVLRGVKVRDFALDGEWERSKEGAAWSAHATGMAEGGFVSLEANGENGASVVTGTAERIDLGRAMSLFSKAGKPEVEGAATLAFSARNTGKGWELDGIRVAASRVAIDNAAWETVALEGSLGASTGHFLLSARSPKMRLAADVRRGGEWPLDFVLDAAGVPTNVLLAAAGKPAVSSGGTWNAEGSGRIRLADIASGKEFAPEIVEALKFKVSSPAPSIAGAAFQELSVEGEKRGDDISGTIRARTPETALSYAVSLRDPLGFRIEGPFSFRTEGNGRVHEGETADRMLVSGWTKISGSLRSPEKTTGILDVKRFLYRSGGIELAGKDASASLSPEGIRWTGGTLLVSGNPLNVAGKVTWGGDLDARIDGKVPAAAIRLVTDVFERLDGTIRLDVRLTGTTRAPSLVGTGRLEGGILSFRGYAQTFEEMRADAIISKEKLIFEHFEGRSGGGYIDGRGEIPLQFDAHQGLYFSVDFFDVRFPYPDEFRPVVQGHVELVGPYDDFLATGEVEIQSARYTKSLRPEKALLDFRRRLADVTARKEKSDFRVRLDIDGISDGTIRIKNNLADAVVKGEFKIVGDASRVVILGSFDVIEGYVEYQGNRYEVRRATVEFQDPRRNNPRLDGRAETKKGNVTVIVSVTGTLEKYEVDLASDPPLGKNDIVALLSLGVTSVALAGSEGTVSAAAASSIVLGPYKGTFEEGIRGIVGLDKFAIEPSFSATSKSFEPRFIVGKSFGEKFSVSVSTSVGTAAESNALVEYKLLENVFLQGDWESATTTKEGDLGADIKFRYRYRQFRDFLRGRD